MKKIIIFMLLSAIVLCSCNSSTTGSTSTDSSSSPETDIITNSKSTVSESTITDNEYSSLYMELLSELYTMSNQYDSITHINDILNKLPVGYKDTDEIREQALFVTIQYDVLHNNFINYVTALFLPPESRDSIDKIDYNAIKRAYLQLLSKENAFDKWNLKSGLLSWLDVGISVILSGCAMGYWKDDSYYMNIFEAEDNSIKLSSNLPSSKNSNTTYAYSIKNMVVTYINTEDNTDVITAYKILDITKDTMNIFCYKDSMTYTLKLK